MGKGSGKGKRTGKSSKGIKKEKTAAAVAAKGWPKGKPSSWKAFRLLYGKAKRTGTKTTGERRSDAARIFRLDRGAVLRKISLGLDLTPEEYDILGQVISRDFDRAEREQHEVRQAELQAVAEKVRKKLKSSSCSKPAVTQT